MSTLRVSSVRNASSATGGLDIAADGVVSGALPSPNRNLLYNGAMQVSQRGTSTTGITTASYNTADRWYFQLVGLGTWTQDIQNDAPTGSGFRRSFRALCTTADAAPAAGDLLAVQYYAEGQDLQRIAKGTASANQLTLSFWVKSNVTGTYVAELEDNDNSRSVSRSYTISASATWERKTITFPADTTGVLDNDNAKSLTLSFWLGAGSTFTSGTLATTWASTTSANRAVGQTNLAAATNNYWQITGVQLEVGDTATPFEFKSYGQELRECQRYYYRVTPGVVNGALGTGFNVSSTQAAVATVFPVNMRTRPTALEQSGTANQYTVAHGASATQCSSVPIFSVSSNSEAVSLFLVASGLTAGQGSMGRTDLTNGATAYLAWSAEL